MHLLLLLCVVNCVWAQFVATTTTAPTTTTFGLPLPDPGGVATTVPPPPGPGSGQNTLVPGLPGETTVAGQTTTTVVGETTTTTVEGETTVIGQTTTVAVETTTVIGGGGGGGGGGIIPGGCTQTVEPASLLTLYQYTVKNTFNTTKYANYLSTKSSVAYYKQTYQLGRALPTVPGDCSMDCLYKLSAVYDENNQKTYLDVAMIRQDESLLFPNWKVLDSEAFYCAKMSGYCGATEELVRYKSTEMKDHYSTTVPNTNIPMDTYPGNTYSADNMGQATCYIWKGTWTTTTAGTTTVGETTEPGQTTVVPGETPVPIGGGGGGDKGKNDANLWWLIIAAICVGTILLCCCVVCLHAMLFKKKNGKSKTPVKDYKSENSFDEDDLPPQPAQANSTSPAFDPTPHPNHIYMG